MIGRSRLVAALLATALAATACTGDDDKSTTPDKPSSQAPAPAPEPQVPITVRTGKVSGKLAKASQSQVSRQVGALVDKWFEAAYLGGSYPRSDFSKAFTIFTTGVAPQVKADSALLSNADIGKRVDAIEVVRRSVQVDQLAAGKKAQAATARFSLVFETTGDTLRRVTVTGRLMLTKSKSGLWRVFAYDVAKSAGAKGKAA